MKYNNVIRAAFVRRINRFVAEVDIDGSIESVHVKNTGRCRELLITGSEVWLTAPGTPGRKLKYDLVAVRKSNGIIFNIDSQAPNKVVKEWLEGKDFDRIVPEYTYGGSRLDFYMERKGRPMLMEVKGCTLEIDGLGYFPDAPTERGIKHLNELKNAAQNGISSCIAFVIPMPGVMKVLPNMDTAPEFGRALYEAVEAGVKTLYLPCVVRTDELYIDRKLSRKINADILSGWN